MDIAPRYNARDTAIMFSKFLNAKILLGTATPSIETYFNATKGNYGLSELFERYGNLPLPQVEIVNMNHEAKNKKGAWYLSASLKIAIQEALNKKQQIILFQNRRGFVPILQCTQCGWVPGCKNCDVSLTYHKRINHLKCHLCGYQENVPEMCPLCGNTHIRFVGFGTEKIEEEVKAIFPNANVGRLDADSTKGKYSHQNIISAFENGEIDILVGTQMVSKGLDFERVSLVGILNADNLMYFPDFRSFERGFSIITQIMGRAGRKENTGKIYIQTRKPEHLVLKYAIKNDYINFFNNQLQERKMFRYPPYYRLILFSVKHKNAKQANQAAIKLKQLFSKIEELIILGPEEPVYGRIKLYYIRNLLIKIPRNQKHINTRLKLKNIVEKFLAEKNQSGVKIIADADNI